MTFSLNVGQCCLVGNYRENNEDAVAVRRLPTSTVCLVADGMGGQQAGEIASQRAIEVVTRELRRTLPGGDAGMTPQIIRQAVVQANEEILAMGDLDRDLKHMGTTLVLGVWHSNHDLYLASVGDSRAYLIRDGRIEQLTVDHNLYQALIDAGVLTATEAQQMNRHKNVLVRYLGNRDTSNNGPDIRVVNCQLGDRFLLCSDGLTGVVSDQGLLQNMEEGTAVQQWAEALGRLALESGSRDNVSCVVVEVVQGPDAQGDLRKAP